jgi:hypothetical protein
VVARARSVAISDFPRRAVTTLGIPHVCELESRRAAPTPMSGSVIDRG